MTKMSIVIEDNVYSSNISAPNIIYNRCDLWADRFALVTVDESNQQYRIMLAVTDIEVYLGVWLLDIPVKVLKVVEKAIFSKYPNIKRIRYEYGLAPSGYSVPKNHFKIHLPETEDELRARLSKKGRYNIKREKDILTKTFGEYKVEEYEAELCPEEIIELYFQMKEATHGVDYHMSPSDYIKSYHISHIYTLKLGEVIGAILLSCEQCSIVYIENLTYDLNYSKYSCGQILYDIYLSKLIKKGFRDLYLAGGNLDYKKRYGSIEENIFNCIVFRNKTDHFKHALREWLRSIKHKYLQ